MNIPMDMCTVYSVSFSSLGQIPEKSYLKKLFWGLMAQQFKAIAAKSHDLSSPHGRRGERTSTSCSLSFAFVSWHVWVYTCPVSKHEKNFKLKRFDSWFPRLQSVVSHLESCGPEVTQSPWQDRVAEQSCSCKKRGRQTERTRWGSIPQRHASSSLLPPSRSYLLPPMASW